MQRPANLPCLALGIQRLRRTQRVRVRLEDASQRWPLSVDVADALEIGLCDRDRRALAVPHALLEIRNRDLVELESLNRRVGVIARRLNGRSTRARDQRRASDGSGAQEVSPADG